MEVLTSETLPLGADRSVHAFGKFYWVRNDGPQARWNRLAFQLLYGLYQMTVTEIPRQGAPFITIAK